MTARGFGPVYLPLLILSAIFLACAIFTLMPNPSAPWPNVMGYRSVCPFAPGATFACSMLAAATCVARARLVRKLRGPIIVPIVVIGILAGGLGVSSAAWAEAKAAYSPEALSGASVPSR